MRRREVRGVGGVLVVGEEDLAEVLGLGDADGLDHQPLVAAHEQEAPALALEAQLLDLPAQRALHPHTHSRTVGRHETTLAAPPIVCVAWRGGGTHQVRVVRNAEVLAQRPKYFGRCGAIEMQYARRAIRTKKDGVVYRIGGRKRSRCGSGGRACAFPGPARA